MNPLIIILGVVVIFLLYQLYLIYISAPTQATNIYLGSKTQIPPVGEGSISNPSATSYTFAFWIYINSFSENINEFIGFGDGKGNTTTPLTSDIGVANLPDSNASNDNLIKKISDLDNVCTFSMDNTTPTLYANISTNKLSGGETYIQSIPITNNLPIQTWTYILISVSTIAGPFVDCYVNGKLVTSQQLNNGSNALTPHNPQSPSNSNKKNTILFSGPPSNSQDRDIYLNKISWIPTAVDPQTAWAYYNQGNGNPTGSGVLSSYHLQVIFTANDKDTSLKLF